MSCERIGCGEGAALRAAPGTGCNRNSGTRLLLARNEPPPAFRAHCPAGTTGEFLKLQVYGMGIMLAAPNFPDMEKCGLAIQPGWRRGGDVDTPRGASYFRLFGAEAAVATSESRTNPLLRTSSYVLSAR